MLEALLLSQDPKVVQVIRSTLEKLSIKVEICHEAMAAADILISEKFDAIIVDCDDLKGGLGVLRGVRITPSNKNSVTFAVLNGKRTTTQKAFGMGVNFVLQKPISALNASRCFHAALNFMVKERRRYFRQPVKMRVITVVLDDRELKANSTNISEGGIAVWLRGALPNGVTACLKFSLSETCITMTVNAEVAWADTRGHVGFRFLKLPENSRQLLERWLDEQMVREFPGAMLNGCSEGPLGDCSRKQR